MQLEDFTIEIEPWGPSPELHQELSQALLEHPQVQNYFGESRFQLLSLDALDPNAFRKTKPKEPTPPKTFQASFYDYSLNRAVVATGYYDDLDRLRLEDYGVQPPTNQVEFEQALEILREDGDLGPALEEGLLTPYRPMPPLIATELPDGRVERVLGVGLLPQSEDYRHEIIGVNMIQNVIERFEGGAPPFSRADEETCAPPPGENQVTTSSAAGQVWITVSQGGTVLWRFLAVRPAASSGTNGSGIELRYLDYRGKRVLYRAHLPILNVRYDRDACGPYRDWQNQEGMLEAHGTDVAPGFRLCPSPAKTILDSGSDQGNFLGVAIYVQGQEVVLVSEMEAGWYRYVSEWRLHANGTIRPRFGFDGVQNSCTCKRHHHNAYWRFDFDIRTPGNNVVEEFNDPPLFGDKWHTKHYELRRSRNSSRNRRWKISNVRSGESYTLIPGSNDGNADAFGVGDCWILHYRGTEIDDGTGFTTDPGLAKANLDMFLNGENIYRKDVVLWYVGHFTHDTSGGSHIVGPDLVPSNW